MNVYWKSKIETVHTILDQNNDRIYNIFFGSVDSKGNNYFTVKPCAFIFVLCLSLTIITLFTAPILSIISSVGVILPIILGYIDYKMNKALRPTIKENRERLLKNLLKFKN